MAMALGKGGGGGRRGRRGGGRGGPISEINVTPLVDVMLVLLIVFMVAAPLMTVGVPIDLPQTSARPLEPQERPISISITPQGEISIDAEPVALETLAATVTALAGEGIEQRIHVRGDANADYGTVMGVMGALSGAGFTHIGLVTEQATDR